MLHMLRSCAVCSIKDMLYKKRMERELMRAKGLLKEAEKPPGEEVGNMACCKLLCIGLLCIGFRNLSCEC